MPLKLTLERKTSYRRLCLLGRLLLQGKFWKRFKSQNSLSAWRPNPLPLPFTYIITICSLRWITVSQMLHFTVVIRALGLLIMFLLSVLTCSCPCLTRTLVTCFSMRPAQSVTPTDRAMQRMHRWGFMFPRSAEWYFNSLVSHCRNLNT